MFALRFILSIPARSDYSCDIEGRIPQIVCPPLDHSVGMLVATKCVPYSHARIMEARQKFHDYLPVGEHEMDWGLYITAIGFNRVLPGERFPATDHPVAYQFDPARGRRLPEYQLTFITNGSGSFASENTGMFSLETGTAFLLFPDVWHSYRPDPETGWEDFWLGFNGSYIYELCRRGIFNPGTPVYRPKNTEKLLQAFDRLSGVIRETPMKNSMLYSARVLEILALVRETDEKLEDGLVGQRGIVDEAIRLIWGWSYRTITVNDIARRLNVNRRTLERYFREVLNRSVLDEIVRCRVTRARRLLDNTHIPIGQIAMMAGFSSSLQMRRSFYQFFNITPEQYRRSQRKQ